MTPDFAPEQAPFDNGTVRRIGVIPFGKVGGGGLENNVLRSDVQSRIGRGEFETERRQHPMTGVPLGSTEGRPQRRQIGRVLDHQGWRNGAGDGNP